MIKIDAMDDIKVSICRLCLKISSGDKFEVLNETSRMHIAYVLPEIDMSTSNSPIICSACLRLLRDSYNFKTACVEIETYLEKFVTPTKQLDLEEVISNKIFEGEEQNSNKEENRTICRLCLTVINNSNSFSKLGIIEENIIQKCIPEMDLTLTEDPVSCENCMEYLHSHFNFIMRCLDIDETINSYLLRNDRDICNLSEVLNFSKCIENMDWLSYNPFYGESDDQKFEIKRELGDCEANGTGKKVESIKDDLKILTAGLREDIHTESESSLAPKLILKCEVCPYTTNRKYSLSIHKLIHKKTEEVTLYRCPECSHETKRKGNLLIHLLKHKNPSEIRMHHCKDCPYKTRLRSNLLKHELVHKPPEEITMHRCEKCPYQTKLKGNLIIHMIQHKSPEEIVMHRCEECSYMTKLKNNLKKHILVHRSPDEVTMYRCTTCEYQSKWKSHLMRHMNLHRSEEANLHKCDQCSYVANQKYNLKKHLLTHKTSDEVPMHKCDLCDFQTKRKDKIKQHMDNMHNCSMCGYQTKDKKELNVHIMESHEIIEEIFKCDMCTYEAKQKRYLQRHKKKTH